MLPEAVVTRMFVGKRRRRLIAIQEVTAEELILSVDRVVDAGDKLVVE